MTLRKGSAAVFALIAVACMSSPGAEAPKAGTIDWANRGEEPKAPQKGYLPSATAESQGGDSAKVAAWVRELDRLGDVHGFVVLRRGHLVAEGYWAPYDKDTPHALYGLASVIGAAAVGADAMEKAVPSLPSGDRLAALTAGETEQTLGEALAVRQMIKDHRMWYEQFVTRHFSAFLGFSWERNPTPGDGAGRKTKVRDLALVGQLLLQKGDWYGRRLLNADWAEQYYRFFVRPSGLRVARGERGQMLAVLPSSALVVAVVADTAAGDRLVSLVEGELVPAFGDQPYAENPIAADGLVRLCKGLSMPGVKDRASCGATLGATYDLPANRYGYSQFRLSRTKDGGNLELVRPGCAQVLSFASAPKRKAAEFVFADSKGKDPLFANGRYRVSVTGGWQSPKKCLVRVYLTESADRYDFEIDLADADAPRLTVIRGSEQTSPLVLTGRRAQEICGVKRLQPRAEIIWTHPIRKAEYIGWPTVMRRKSGELIASYSGNREAHVCPYGREELVRSFDGGETWTRKPEIFHNSIIDDRDSGIVETQDGSLVAAWFSSTSFAGAYPKALAKLPKELVDAARGYWTRRSTDGGRTWEKPVSHRGSAPHGAIRLKDGRVLFVGTAHNRGITWNPKHDPEGKSCLMVEESRDDGRSWQVLSTYVPQKPFFAWEDTFEPYPVETSDGRILVFCRSEKLPVMTQVESTDGGRTWGPMSKTPIQGLPPHFVVLSDGKIVCTYANRKTLHEMAVVSEDQGRTWDVKNAVLLSKGTTADMGYPSTVQNDDGTLLTVYYQAETAKESPCLMATKWRLSCVDWPGVENVARPSPKPNAATLKRIEDDDTVIGIVHFTVNTFTDREWGYGSEEPKVFDPTDFNAEQIVKACADGGIRGLVVVAKHHDGFCLWPTKTTNHNISKSPFRGGKGDYVKEMSEACRKFGVKFGVYCSPWDRNNAEYGHAKYVETYHEQIRELTSGAYGPIFELWLDGANGGDGYYGGAWERRTISGGYYRFEDVVGFVRGHNPDVTVFGFGGEWAWPGNESGIVDSQSGCTRGTRFRPYEADFPLRPGWFYHQSQDGFSRSGEFLMKVWLRTVGNAATMNIGISPDRRGRLADEDVAALRRFAELKRAFFVSEVTSVGRPFNLVIMEEDVRAGEQVDAWRLMLDGREIAQGKKIGFRRIRTFEQPVSGRKLKLEIPVGMANPEAVKVRSYYVEPSLLEKVLSSSEPKQPPAPFELRGVLSVKRPDSLTFTVKQPQTIRALMLTPDKRHLGSTPVVFRLSYSRDGENWVEDKTEYRLDNVRANPITQRVDLFQKTHVKYIRLTAVRTLEVGMEASLSGLELVP